MGEQTEVLAFGAVWDEMVVRKMYTQYIDKNRGVNDIFCQYLEI